MIIRTLILLILLCLHSLCIGYPSWSLTHGPIGWSSLNAYATDPAKKINVCNHEIFISFKHAIESVFALTTVIPLSYRDWIRNARHPSRCFRYLDPFHRFNSSWKKYQNMHTYWEVLFPNGLRSCSSFSSSGGSKPCNSIMGNWQIRV